MNSVKILGLDFFNDQVEKLNSYLIRSGGLVVVPAAPALVENVDNPLYYRSLEAADIVLPDSGYMCLCWNFLSRKKVKKLSGLLFLREFLNFLHVKKEFSKVVFIVPTLESANSIKRTLEKLHNVDVVDNQFYVLKTFRRKEKVYDEKLVRLIQESGFRHVIINVGGGIQELLGAYIKSETSGARVSIVCTGAALLFMTGEQVRIPVWGDRIYMGWLFRIVSDPSKYFMRYFKALKLISLLRKFGSQNPDV